MAQGNILYHVVCGAPPAAGAAALVALAKGYLALGVPMVLEALPPPGGAAGRAG